MKDMKRYLVFGPVSASAFRLRTPQLESCFRLIVANPPYVDSGYAPIMHPEVRDFEPHVALFGGAGGLVQIRRLLPQVARRLMPQGLYMQEFAAGHGDEVLELARQAGLTRCEVLPDFAGIERTLVAGIN